MPIKYYRLRKNLPTFNAGDVFYLSDAGNLFRESDNVPVYGWTIIDKNPNILIDWFEEIKEPTRWKPEMHQVYYYINSDGYVGVTTWTDDYFDNGRFEIGNCFQTKEEAEKVKEYLKALAVVRGDSTKKFVKGERNWYVVYDTAYNCLLVKDKACYIENGIFGLPYFATEDDARRSIEIHENEWLTIFGVREEVCD